MLLPPATGGECGWTSFTFGDLQEEDGANEIREVGMDDDDTSVDNSEAAPAKQWSEFSPGHLKQEIEEAWRARQPGSPTYDVVIQVEGNNPISGYRVIVRPSGP
jgi:hypothetical protein